MASLPYCVCRGDHWSPANLPPQRIFRDGFLARQTGTDEQCSPLQAFFGSSAEGSRPLPTEQKEKSASKETCPGEMNPAPTPLYAFHSYLLTPHSFQVLTMPQTPKLSPQQKVALVEKIKAGEISRQAAAQSVGVSNTTVRQWLRIYESEGADGLAPREKSRHLTAEEKQAAVAEYLAGGVSLFDVCKKYGIRSPQNLQKLVEKAQAGGELRGYHGASRHRGGAYTTAADREKIVRECLADGCDYGAAALKYNVDYKALVHWVGQYRAGAALHDARHSSEGTSRARGRARTVPPMQRMVMVLDCLENRKNYGAMAQKYAIAYHQIYRWVQRYLQDGWLGMNDRRGPADDPDPAGEWGKIAPAGEADAELWVAKCKGVPEALPAMLRRAGYSWMMVAKILFDLARM